jgi:hypothetical protein
LKTVKVACVVGRSQCLSADNNLIVTVGRSHAMYCLSVVLHVGEQQLMHVFMLLEISVSLRHISTAAILHIYVDYLNSNTQ